jgi:hypothetical protein
MNPMPKNWFVSKKGLIFRSPLSGGADIRAMTGRMTAKHQMLFWVLTAMQITII